MIFIPENIIEETILHYETASNYENDLKTIMQEQPDLMSFIDHENYSLLTHDEIVLLEYLCLVIYFSCTKMANHTLFIAGKNLEKAEEENWDLFNSSNTKSITKIFDRFFENYAQEDLLALVEDSVQLDEDNMVTSVGREIIFVACKSIIDTIHTSN